MADRPPSGFAGPGESAAQVAPGPNSKQVKATFVPFHTAFLSPSFLLACPVHSRLMLFPRSFLLKKGQRNHDDMHHELKRSSWGTRLRAHFTEVTGGSKGSDRGKHVLSKAFGDLRLHPQVDLQTHDMGQSFSPPIASQQQHRTGPARRQESVKRHSTGTRTRSRGRLHWKNPWSPLGEGAPNSMNHPAHWRGGGVRRDVLVVNCILLGCFIDRSCAERDMTQT